MRRALRHRRVQQGIAHVLPQRRQHFLGLAVLVRVDHNGLVAVERLRATAHLAWTCNRCC
ncbi:hypothetical protein WJ970_19940 [Achromobacter xylosoxidans]